MGGQKVDLPSIVGLTILDFPPGTILPGERIFHLDTDVIQAYFELIRVVFSLIIKHTELYPQLLILYRPDLLQGEERNGGVQMKTQGGEWQEECDNQTS